MALNLRHLKGFNGTLHGSVKAHPRHPGGLFYVVGASIVVGQENNLWPQRVLSGHDDAISAFAVSNGGELLASGQRGKNSDIVVWNTKDFTQRFRFQEHDLEVTQLCFSPDDRLLITIGHEKDNKLFVVDTVTGKIVAKQALEYGKRVTAVAWAPSPSPGVYAFATAAGLDGDVHLWTLNPYTGMVSGQRSNPGSVRRMYTSLVFSPDGCWLYGGTTSADVVTINVLRKTIQMVHPVCGSGVGALMLDPTANGCVLAAGRDGSLTHFTHASNWRELKPFATLPGAATSISINADASAFIVGTSHGSIYRYGLASRSIVTISDSHTGPLTGVSFAPGLSDAVATSSQDGSVCVWSTQNYTLQSRAAEQVQEGALCVALAPEVVYSGWADGTIRCHQRPPPDSGLPARILWSIPSAHSLAHSCGVTALKVSNRGLFLATGGAGGELRVWDVRSRELVAHMKLHAGQITDLAVMPDDAHLLAASDDRSWTIWDVQQEKCRATWRGLSMIKGLAVSPDKTTIVTVGLDQRLQVWDLRQQEPVRTVVGAHAAEVCCVAFDPSGRAFATGGADCVVKVWDFARCQVLSEGAGVHTAPVTKVDWSPDGRQLVSVARDSSMAIWDVAW